MRSQNFKHLFHLDPAPDGAAGGAANPGSPVGGDAAPAFDASQYVPKADFDRISSDYTEFRQTAEQRFQDYDSRLPKPEVKEPKADKEPDAESGEYDFSKPGEFNRFQRELAQFHLKQEFAQREASWREQSEAQEREARSSDITREARSRDMAYIEAHPEYQADLRNADLKFDRQVALTIQDSEFSAQIKHYLAKNPAKVAEIREVASKSKIGMDAAIRMVGRIEAMFEQKAAPVVPAGKPTRNAFGAGSAKPSQRDPLEIVKEWRS